VESHFGEATRWQSHNLKRLLQGRARSGRAERMACPSTTPLGLLESYGDLSESGGTDAPLLQQHRRKHHGRWAPLLILAFCTMLPTRAEVPTRKRAAELGGEWRRAAALVRQPVSSERLQQLGQQKWQGQEA
jgi:hypothetical protein